MANEMQGRTPEQQARAAQCAGWSFVLMLATLVIGTIYVLVNG